MSNLTQTANRKKKKTCQQHREGEGGGTPKNHWRGCAARFSKSWPYFRPKHGIFHTGFQTWPLKSLLVFKPGGGHKTQHTCLRRQIISSLLRWERQQKNVFLKIHFEFAYYGFISYSFRTNRQISNMFIHHRSSPENYTRFQTKTAQKHYPLVRHIPKWLI